MTYFITKMDDITTEEGGYECDFVSVTDDTMCCRICLSVARDPRQHGKCGQLYCYTCLEKYKEDSTSCPYCNKDYAHFFEDNRSHRQIQSLIVRCSRKQDGCVWKGELRYLQDHTDSKCDYREIKCPLKCDATMKWITLDHHVKEECPNRLIRCPGCGEEGPFRSITTDHKEECLYILEKCPTPGCDVEICSALMTFHLQTECEYSLVECRYSRIGCTAILTRKDMEDHENNDSYHLKLLAQSHTSLKEKYQQLEVSTTSLQEKHRELETSNILQQEKCRELEATNNQLLTTCDKLQETVRFLKCRLNERSQYSPTYKISHTEPRSKIIKFFATPQTYKFKATFQRLQRRKTLTDLLIEVVQGENDHNLDWPFSGKVKVQILNSMEDNDHLTLIINIPAQGRPGYSQSGCYSSRFEVMEKYKYKGYIHVRFTVISNVTKPWLYSQ